MFKALSTIFTDFTESLCNQFSKKTAQPTNQVGEDTWLLTQYCC